MQPPPNVAALPINTHHVNGMPVANLTKSITQGPVITPAVAAFSPGRLVRMPSRKTPSRIPRVTEAIDSPDYSTEPQWLATIPTAARIPAQNMVENRDTIR